MKIRRQLPASGIRRIFDLATQMERSGKTILHLEIGRPDWPVPNALVEKAVEALNAGYHHYLPNRGLLELREAIAQRIKQRTNVSYDPEKELIVTLGASEAVCMAVLALIGEGDEVIIPVPVWPHYEAIVLMAGGTPVFLEGRAEDGFLYDPERLASLITPRTRMLILNSPCNPTGAVQPRERLEAIARLAEQRGIYVLSDEVYEDFVYEGEHVSLTSLMKDRSLLILVNSLSKCFAMTGWRIGWVAAVPEVSDFLNRVHQYLTVCGVAFAQKAAAAILNHPSIADYSRSMRDAFRQRYMVWKNAFQNCSSVSLVVPAGAFYIFPRFNLGIDSEALCLQCLEKAGVSMVPGRVFGASYDKCVRISYGGNIETQKEAASRLLEFLDTLRKE